MSNWIERKFLRYRFKHICRVLGIEPFPLVAAYVLDGDLTIFSGGRQNGKTMAVILEALVYKKISPDFPKDGVGGYFRNDPDYIAIDRFRMRWYRGQLADAVARCEAAGIQVRREKWK